MPDMPRTKFNSPWTVENIETELNGTKNARGTLTMAEKFEQKVETSTYATDKAAIDAGIAAVANAGAKNLFNIDATPVANHTDFTLADGKLTVTANGNWAHYSVPLNLPAGNYTLSTVISGYSKASGAPDTSMRLRMSATTSDVTYIVLQTITGNGAINVPFTWTGGTIYLQFYPNFNATAYANSFSAGNTMIRRAEITDQTYEPYAMSNPVITPAAIKAVDEGVKNLIDVGEPRTITLTEVTVTVNSDGTLNATTSSATAAERNFWLYDDKAHMPDGIEPGKTYCFYSNSETSDFGIDVWNSTNGTSWDSHFVVNVGTFVIVTIPTATVGLGIRMNIPKSKTLNNVKAYPMICTVEDWAVSQKFVPYCPTLYELYQMVLALQNGA